MSKLNRYTFLKLEYFRKKYGFSQTDMSSLLGIKQAAYSNKVNGYAPFKFNEMMIICKALNKKTVKQGDKLLTLDEIFIDL